MCVQEHWLTDDSIHDLDNINSSFGVFASSAMSDILGRAIFRGRPFGGIAMFISNKILAHCALIHKAPRFMIFRVYDHIIVNVYMPTNNNNEYADTLFEISEYLHSIGEYDKCIVCGDFNYSFSCSNNKLLETYCDTFLHDNNLQCTFSFLPNNGVNEFSYCNDSLQHRSLIDHFLVTKNLLPNILSVSLVNNGNNLSDHCGVCLKLISLVKKSSVSDHIKSNDNSDTNYKLRWDKSNLNIYYNLTLCYLQPIFDWIKLFDGDIESESLHDDSANLINNVYNDIICALKKAEICIIKKPVSFYKFWWDAELDDLKEKSMQSFKLWEALGKPKNGYVYLNMVRDKMNYKKGIKYKRDAKQKQFTDKLNNNLQSKKLNDFWKCWNSKLKRKTSKCACVEGHTSDIAISNAFAGFFSKTSVANNQAVHDAFQYNFEHKFPSYMGKCNKILLEMKDIEMAINKLKQGKASGFDGISSEHLVYSHPIILSILLRLFNLMMKHGFVPDAFGNGIIIPILKSNNDPTKCDSYRGITLSPILSKIFENCILSKCNNFMSTSDLQFGFKGGLGCNDALFTLKNVVDFFTKRGNTINICALDISKAFDKVSHYGLFEKLMEKGAPKSLIEVIKCWYSKCNASVKWNGTISENFTTTSGVRQGGILSPILFSLYINELIVNLSDSHTGCHIGGQFMGSILYADDILLLSVSFSDMQSMLDICSVTAGKLDLKFNVSKSAFMRIGSRHNSPCAVLTLCNQPLVCVTEIKYLGVFIKSGKKFATAVTQVKSKFYRCFNALYSKCHSSSSEVVCVNLLKYYCLPLIMYAVESVDPNKSYVKMLDNLITQAFMKIFHTYDAIVINDIRYHFNVPYIGTYIYERKVKLFCRFMTHDLYFSKNICTVFGIDNLIAGNY